MIEKIEGTKIIFGNMEAVERTSDQEKINELIEKLNELEESLEEVRMFLNL